MPVLLVAPTGARGAPGQVMHVSPALGSGLDLRTQRAAQLMHRFLDRTGITSDAPVQRYLWTDAFAVCNLLALERVTGEPHYLELALQLVESVHHTLGRHREDDSREGWLSGLSDLGANTHPTWGGLRIGKPLPERKWDDAIDEPLEWERDGQYFHYLTKWMHGLDQLSRRTRDGRYNVWARELAAVAWAAFSMEPSRTSGAGPEPSGGGTRRLVWKMSIDLSRPLVSTMGHHDALDGLITSTQLQATADRLGLEDEGPSLEEERAGFARMVEGSAWATSDPLGLGSLLSDAYRLSQLQAEGARFDDELLASMLSAALEGLAHFAHLNGLARPALARLAFRELGLAVGLHALERLTRTRGPHTRRSREEARLLEALSPAAPLGAQLDAFWLKPENREAASWFEHRDLNEVTLATSLCPLGFLELAPR